MSEDQSDIQKEMLELTIKAGRRMMHDFKHAIDEIPSVNPNKGMFQERAKIWGNIFYPDDGPKNYRSSLHLEITNLELEILRLKKILESHNIDSTPNLPF